MKTIYYVCKEGHTLSDYSDYMSALEYAKKVDGYILEEQIETKEENL